MPARHGWSRPVGVLGWVAGAWLLARPRPFAPGVGGWGRLSVIIPARDEERALPLLLASLAAQHRPASEVIVVDDASTDGTGALARAAGATVVDSLGPPPGWSGKCWALHQGQAVATGDLLVFLDADVTLAPDALDRIAAAHGRLGGAGIVSAEPWHRTEDLREQLSSVCNVIALMGTGAFAPVGRAATMAFGPCLAIDRATYDACGGHSNADVRARICEDLHLARAVRRVGRPVVLATGGDVVAMRMYPAGVRQAFDGWTKVLATGAGAGSPAVTAGVAAWVTGALLAAASGARVLRALARGRRPARGDAARYFAWAAQVAWLQRGVGGFGPTTAAAFPVPLGFFVAAFTRSVVKVGLGRPMQWRGRSLRA